MSDIVERLVEKAGLRRIKAVKDVMGWTKPSPRFAILREAADEITRLRTLISKAEQREKDARVKAVEDVLSALTAHELYQYRPKAFKGFIDYARSALQSEER